MTVPYWLQIVAATGLTIVIVYGSILQLPREYLKRKVHILNSLLSCSMCVGFWAGLTVGYINTLDISISLHIAFASSASSWLYDSVVGFAQTVDVNYPRRKTK